MIASALRFCCAAGCAYALIACARQPAKISEEPAISIEAAPSSVQWMPGHQYNGPADTSLARSFVIAGGSHFSVRRAMENMIGDRNAGAESRRLAVMFGATAVEKYERSASLVMRDLASMTPDAAGLSGIVSSGKLARELVRAAMDSDRELYAGYLLDHMLSHPMALRAIGHLADDPACGPDCVRDFLRLLSQQLYDLSKILGIASAGPGATSWTLSDNVHILKGPRERVLYAYYGTGRPTSDESVVMAVKVRPHATYRFSAYVDPANIVQGEFDLFIDRADGRATFVSLFRPRGKPMRYQTPKWSAPAGVSEVLLGMQLVSATVKRGKKLSFSDPTLSLVR